jgi:hypothetical protein
MRYRDAMGTDDQPLGLSIDIGKILKDVTEPKRTTRRRSSTSRSTNDMDAAMRRAVRAELGEVERALRDIAEEIVRLRKAQDALADKVAKLAR